MGLFYFLNVQLDLKEEHGVRNDVENINIVTIAFVIIYLLNEETWWYI